MFIFLSEEFIINTKRIDYVSLDSVVAGGSAKEAGTKHWRLTVRVPGQDLPFTYTVEKEARAQWDKLTRALLEQS